MIDYMVRDWLWNEYVIRPTLEEAKEYVARQLAYYPDYNEDGSDFVIYKRERIA